ncbi:MAG: ParA family protein [Myxococcota bacterium]
MLELLVAYGLLPEARPQRVDLPPLPDLDAAGPPAVLALASARPRSGQTSLTMGLALAWSLAGRRVLVADLDLAEPLARLLQLGASVDGAAEHTLLHALTSGRTVEPRNTLLPNVDLVVAGNQGSLDGDAIAHLLRRKPASLRAALAGAVGAYDRVLLDCPLAPATLTDAGLAVADHVVAVLPCDAIATPSPLWAKLRREGAPPVVGIALTRWKPGSGPDAAWLQEVYGGARSVYFDTVIPELAALHDAWDVVAGTAGPALDEAFFAIAQQIDDRLDHRELATEAVQ